MGCCQGVVSSGGGFWPFLGAQGGLPATQMHCKPKAKQVSPPAEPGPPQSAPVPALLYASPAAPRGCGPARGSSPPACVSRVRTWYPSWRTPLTFAVASLPLSLGDLCFFFK